MRIINKDLVPDSLGFYKVKLCYIGPIVAVGIGKVKDQVAFGIIKLPLNNEGRKYKDFNSVIEEDVVFELVKVSLCSDLIGGVYLEGVLRPIGLKAAKILENLNLATLEFIPRIDKELNKLITFDVGVGVQ